jgi:beta-glucosidase
MKEWGFDGILCTDGGGLSNLVKEHHAFKTMPEATAAAIHAGINQFLDNFKQPLTDALAQGLLTEADLDRNLRGVFRVMIKLGMLDGIGPVPQAKLGLQDTADPWNTAAPRALVRKVTDESIVLLKNDASFLPLDPNRLKSIAVIGPLADKVILDWYSGTPPYTVTPYAGIKAAASGAKVSYLDGKDLAAAAALAKASDVAIVVIGNHPWCDAGWEKCPLPSDGKEAVDRKSLTLEQEEIAKAVYAANPRTVVVLQASFPYTTNWSQEHIPAILEMTHNSQEQGNGLADVLFGAYNPGGKLTQTWVKDMADLPPMMDYNLRDGRTYLYAKQKPLYPFGYGLSYTTFAYSHLKLDRAQLHSGETVKVSVDVKNTGSREGDEVVELYVSHVGSKVERPQQELKGFARVHLKAGETRPVSLNLPAASLTYWDQAAKAFVLEADKVEVKVGGSSDKLPVSATLPIAN